MIKKVIIQNFRCLENFSLNFQKLQALVGENGSGKTAVLEAIDYATSKEYASRKISEQDFCNSDLSPIHIEVYFDKFFIIQLKDGYATKNVICSGVSLTVKRRSRPSPRKALSDGFTIEHYVIPVEYEDNKHIDPSFLPKDISTDMLPTNMTKTTEGFSSRRASSSKPWQIANQLLSLAGDLVGYPSVFYFDRQRELEGRVGYNSLFQRVVRELNWRYRKDADLAIAEQNWEPYYRGVINVVEDKKSNVILEPIREELTKILSKDFSNLEISLLNLEQPFIQAFFSIRNDGELNQVEFNALGSGISTVIAYALLKVISYLSKEEIIFLIDEPELHLHPQAQSNLFRDFTEASHQVVYTTHSDSFVSLKYWDGVIRIDRDKIIYPKQPDLDDIFEGKAVKEHLDEVRKLHLDETIYFRENNEIFFSRKVLLVEGPGEKYGIPRISQLFSKEMKEVTVISCNGKNKIPHYQLLCKAFGIPFFTLFDLDNEAVASTANARIIGLSSSADFYHFTTNFEAVLGGTGSHKTTDLLIKIDSMSKTQTIDKEITDAIEKISKWSLQ